MIDGRTIRSLLSRLAACIGICMLITSVTNARQPGLAVPVPASVSFITGNVETVRSLAELNEQDILEPKWQQQFSLLPAKDVVYDKFTPYYHWFRFHVRNDSSQPTAPFLLMGPMGQRSSVLYRYTNGQLVAIGQTGTRFRFRDRTYPHVHSVFPLEIRGNTVDTFYMSMDYSHNYKAFAFALSDANTFQNAKGTLYYVFGIMTGILALFFLLNIYLYFALRDRIHLWYAFYILSVCYLLLKHEGFDEQFFGLDTDLSNRLSPIMGLGAISIFLLMKVVQLFFVNIIPSGFLYKTANFIRYNLLVATIAEVITFYIEPEPWIENLVFEWANKSTLLGVVIIVISCVASFRRGNKAALFVLFGMLFFLVGAVEKLLALNTWSYIMPPSLFQVGLVLEAVIISFGLMYRYNLFKKERESLALALEKKNREAAAEILQTQEAEQQRIAMDLHDELGGNLAALKMTVQRLPLPADQTVVINQLIDAASDKARIIAHNLMPPEFETTPLAEILDRFFSRLNTEGNIRFNFLSSGEPGRLNKQQELMVYRIILELSNNIIRHSGTSEATVQLIYYATHVEIMTEDSGRGFSIDPQHQGIGLRNIQARVNYLRGSINIDSSSKGATTIIQLPYSS